MDYQFQSAQHAAAVATDCVIVGIYKGGTLSTAAQQIDATSGAAIQNYLAMGDFSGDAGQTQLLYQLSGVKAERVLLVGLGEKGKLTLELLTQATESAAKTAKAANVAHVMSFLTDECVEDYAAAAVRQSILAVGNMLYSFDEHKSKKDDSKDKKQSLQTWIVAHTSVKDYSQNATEGRSLVAGVELSRDLANSPGNVCTPTYLADNAKKLAKSSKKVSLDVLEEKDMEKLGMGSFLSVSKGSDQPGKMIVLNYKGGKDGDKPVVLVGKGITFDTGGISLKPGPKMDEMKYDMTGAASVLGTLQACVAMELPLNIVVIVAAAENMPSGRASKPGDIVTAMSGLTIEILNTDAEGRLVLCDALTYAERFEPAAVIDVATLTGACIVALGHHTSGLLSNNDDFADEILTAGKDANDEAWRLPMGEKYQKQLESNFADMANIGGPPAGTITAACFLSRFTENYTWAHLDIAGTAWNSGANKGATGRPVPLLTQVLMNRAKASAD